MSVIEEVKQKTDITEIVGQYVTLKKSGRNLSAPCPFHSEKHPSFFVYPEQQSWHCFGACNTGGDVFSFIMKKEGYDFGEALRVLAERAGVTLPTYRQDDARKEEKEDFFRLNEAAALYFHNNLLNAPAAEKARQYVEKRGYTRKTVTDFTLGYSLNEWETLKKYLAEKGHEEKDMVTGGLLYENEDGRTTDRFRGKLMIPIRDSRGRVTGFGARVLDDSLPKYVNSPQTPTFDKSGTLYAIDRAAPDIRKKDGAIVMEGYMDVITAHQHGVTNTVASMGTAITEKQIQTLRKLSNNLILVLDADTAGKNAMLIGGRIATNASDNDKAYDFKPNAVTGNISEKDVKTDGSTWVFNTALENIDAKIMILPEGKDPDDIIKSDINLWHDLLTKAIPVYDYLFDMTTAELDLTTARGKSLAVERLNPIINGMFDDIRQAHYIQKLARMVDVDVNTIKSSLTMSKPTTTVRRRTPVPPTAAGMGLRPLVTTSAEEYVLALMLQNPTLKNDTAELTPEVFNGTENREIYRVWMETEDIPALQERLAAELLEHLDTLISRKPPETRNNVQDKFADSVRRLLKKYLKGLAANRSQTGETSDDIGMKIHELETQDSRKRSGSRR